MRYHLVCMRVQSMEFLGTAPMFVREVFGNNCSIKLPEKSSQTALRHIENTNFLALRTIASVCRDLLCRRPAEGNSTFTFVRQGSRHFFWRPGPEFQLIFASKPGRLGPWFSIFKAYLQKCLSGDRNLTTFARNLVDATEF